MLRFLSVSNCSSLNCFHMKYESKKGDKDKETILSSTTPDPGYDMGK